MSHLYRATWMWLLCGSTLFAQQPSSPTLPTPLPATPVPVPAMMNVPQGMMMAAQPATSNDDDGLTIRESSVGYIDNAVPASQIFLRYDAGYNFRFPNRAEMFYAQNRPGGAGLPLNERSIDYQDILFAVEKTVRPNLSLFLEAPLRLLNPEINDNQTGFGDFSLGFKYGFYQSELGIATLQLRGFVPSGNPNKGLGNNHGSLEPAILLFAPVTDRLGFAGELRYWFPISGSSFASTVFRYGLGARYELYRTDTLRVASTTEFIGWQVYHGRESRLSEANFIDFRNTRDTTILNAKVGVRVDFLDRYGFYMGYGRSLTGTAWYEDILRLEFRMLF